MKRGRTRRARFGVLCALELGLRCWLFRLLSLDAAPVPDAAVLDKLVWSGQTRSGGPHADDQYFRGQSAAVGAD